MAGNALSSACIPTSFVEHEYGSAACRQHGVHALCIAAFGPKSRSYLGTFAYLYAESHGGHTWLAERVSKAAKTWNVERDAIAERYRACFMDIIDACMEGSLNIACAHGASQARRTAQKIESSADANATFAKVTQIDRLDVKWFMQLMAQHTDLTMAGTLDVYKVHARAPLELFCYLPELLFALRLPKQCLVKWVLFEVCKERYVECDSRGADVLKKGGVNADKTMNWRDHGAYQLKITKKCCTQVVHKASGLAFARHGYHQVRPSEQPFGSLGVCGMPADPPSQSGEVVRGGFFVFVRQCRSVCVFGVRRRAQQELQRRRHEAVPEVGRRAGQERHRQGIWSRVCWRPSLPRHPSA